MSPEVTVVTAVHNGARFLDSAIAGVVAQTFTDWEHIVVDDASDDATAELVRRWTATDPRIRLLERRARGGPYTAANGAIAQASGRVIVRLDADDVPAPARIERQLAFMAEHGLEACATWWRAIGPTGEATGELGRPSCSPRALAWMLCVRQGLAHSSACFTRAAFDAVGGYRPEAAAQDLRLWCDLSRRGATGIFEEVLVDVRRPGGITGAMAGLQERLALAALVDHVRATAGGDWSEAEVRALRPYWTGDGLPERLAALQRWTLAWRRDPALGPADHERLADLAREVCRAVVRQALRRDGVSVATLRGLLALRRAV